jgi:2Fe-2S ferredoxin
MIEGSGTPVVGHMVRVEPAGVEIDIRSGETLLDAAWRNGYSWPTTCRGQARCTSCHVLVAAGAERTTPSVDPEEQAAIARLRRLWYRDAQMVRLACRMSVTGDVVVEQHQFRAEHQGRT